MFLIAPGLFVLPMDRSGTPANAFKAGSQGAVPVGGGADDRMEALVEQEFRDAGYGELVRRAAEFDRFAGRGMNPGYVISEIAATPRSASAPLATSSSEQPTAAHPSKPGVARPRAGSFPTHLSPLIRVWPGGWGCWMSARVVVFGPSSAGRMGKTDVPPAKIPVWIAGRGGMRAIYESCNSTGQRENDLVFTSPALARRIVDYLDPKSFCIDPCRGRGAFYDALNPENRDWCEIREGRDFLTWEFGRPVDWCITNPPFSDAYADIAARAFSISENVAFLVKLPVAIGTYARHRAWREAGHETPGDHLSAVGRS